MSYTYILKLANGKYYVGSTYSLKNRIAEHNSGLDFYTKQHLPVELVYYEEYQTKEEAAKRVSNKEVESRKERKTNFGRMDKNLSLC